MHACSCQNRRSQHDLRYWGKPVEIGHAIRIRVENLCWLQLERVHWKRRQECAAKEAAESALQLIHLFREDAPHPAAEQPGPQAQNHVIDVTQVRLKLTFRINLQIASSAPATEDTETFVTNMRD